MRCCCRFLKAKIKLIETFLCNKYCKFKKLNILKIKIVFQTKRMRHQLNIYINTYVGIAIKIIIKINMWALGRV